MYRYIGWTVLCCNMILSGGRRRKIDTTSGAEITTETGSESATKRDNTEKGWRKTSARSPLNAAGTSTFSAWNPFHVYNKSHKSIVLFWVTWKISWNLQWTALVSGSWSGKYDTWSGCLLMLRISVDVSVFPNWLLKMGPWHSAKTLERRTILWAQF